MKRVCQTLPRNSNRPLQLQKPCLASGVVFGCALRRNLDHVSYVYKLMQTQARHIHTNNKTYSHISQKTTPKSCPKWYQNTSQNPTLGGLVGYPGAPWKRFCKKGPYFHPVCAQSAHFELQRVPQHRINSNIFHKNTCQFFGYFSEPTSDGFFFDF